MNKKQETYTLTSKKILAKKRKTKSNKVDKRSKEDCSDTFTRGSTTKSQDLSD